MNCFSSCHPAVAALYFLSVLLLTMFTTHPVMLLLTLLGGLAFAAILDNTRSFGRTLAMYLVLFMLIALTNPLFSHNGVTPLFYLNGNPVTLEAVLYGLDMAAMLIAVMGWFRCFNRVMTGDKLLFLLGRVSPKIALVVSSSLRFVPLFKAQADKIRQTQTAMGRFATDNWWDKLRGTAGVYSALITWSLEKAVDTGSSMKARGYGLKGRSRFALFRFTRGDGVLLGLIAVLDAIVVSAIAVGGLDFAFYPALSDISVGAQNLPAIIAFGALSFLPCILEAKETIQWIYYRSSI